MSAYNKLLKKIKSNNFKVGVIGLGYVGLSLCDKLIQKNIQVYGFEKELEKINKLKNGKNYIPNIKKKTINYFKNNKNTLCDNYQNISFIDVLIVCLPTPLKNFKTPDMSILYNCINKLKLHIKNNQILIIESTVYPGATEELFKKINYKNKFTLGKNFFLIFSPERVNPGDKNFSYDKTPKVVGGATKNCQKLGEIFYKKVSKKIHLTPDIKTAEMSKLLENSYREVNIGLINEIKLISEKLKINIWDVIDAAKTKNFGFNAFYPGPGTGGHCIPIDPIYLVWASKKKNFLPKVIWSSSRINSEMPKIIYRKILKFSKRIKKTKLSILFVGISFKKNIDDIRNSPAVDIISYLLNNNSFKISYIDPFVPSVKLKNKIFYSEKENKLKNVNFDISVITTDHDNINYNLIIKKSNTIIDTRGITKKLTKHNKDKFFYF